MKVKSVRFAMLRATKQYENDRAECEIEIGPKDKIEEAYELAIATCQRGLGISQHGALQRQVDDLGAILMTADGREAFARFVEVQNRRLGR